VATCDGFHEREREALQVFIDRLNLPTSIDALSEDVFDYAEASVHLESTWLRKIFVHACRLMVQMDGRVTPKERDAMRAMAGALGIGEEMAVARLEGEQPPPDRLIEWIESLEVDYVSWDDYNQPGYFWFFPHPAHPLAANATIHVYEGQSLIVKFQDEIADILEPGTYRAVPPDLPGLAELADWTGGPISVELLFMRSGPSPAIRWGLSNGIELHSAEHGAFSLRSYGRCAIRFNDVEAVASRLAVQVVPDDVEVEQRLGRIVAGRFGQAVQGLAQDPDVDIIETLKDIDSLRDRVAPMIREAIRSSGMRLTRFQIENITVPLELGLKPESIRSRTLTRVGSRVLGTQTGTGDSFQTGVGLDSLGGAPVDDHLEGPHRNGTADAKKTTDELSLDETSCDFVPTDNLE